MAEASANELIRLEVTDDGVEGEVALALAPGTRAESQGRTLDRMLSARLSDAAAELGLVLAASPRAFAFVKPGKDEQGRTHFEVRGRDEGGRLVPGKLLPFPGR